jgi:hypothetical protein
MVGEALREIGILVMVFVPLEAFFRGVTDVPAAASRGINPLKNPGFWGRLGSIGTAITFLV